MRHYLSLRAWDGLGILWCGPRCCSCAGDNSARWSNEVAVSHDDLVHPSLGAVLRRELALLDGAFDEDVLPLIEAERHFGQVPVERQARPGGSLLPLPA